MNDVSLSSNLDAKLEQHRARLAEHKEWLNMKSQSVPPKKKTNIAGDMFLDKLRQTPGFSRKSPEHKLKRDRGVSIEDSLISRGLESEENKEKLRAKRYKEEMEHVKPNRKLQKNTIDVIDRLDALEKERTDRLERLRRMTEPKFDFKPKISRASEDMASSRVTYHEITQNISKEERLNAIRKRLSQQDGEEHTFAPKLSNRTVKIVSRMKERRPQGMAIEDYLERKDLERQRQLLEMAESKHNRDEFYSYTPRITEQAAQIVRQGSVTDRLYEESYRINEKKRQFQQSLMQESQFQFQPQINRYRYEEQDESDAHEAIPIHDSLLLKSQMNKMKQRDRMIELERRERELHNPRINPVSAAIASRLPHTSKDRLIDKPRSASAHKRTISNIPVDSRRSKTPKAKGEKAFDFKPVINRKSVQLESRKNQDFDSRVHQWHLNEKRKNEKLIKERRIKEEQEVKECTFEPRKYSKPESHRHSLLSKSFDDRNTQWDRRRKAKIFREQTQRYMNEVKGCTFKPVLNVGPPSSVQQQQQQQQQQQNISYYDHTPALLEPLGFEEFVTRQHDARQRKAESEKRVQAATGSKWRNQLTVPKEFNLGQKNRAHIRSLAPIISPNTKYRLDERIEWNDYSTSFDEFDDDERIIEDSDQMDQDLMLDVIPPQGLFSSRSSIRILNSVTTPLKLSEWTTPSK
jgi:hypothetical protein